MTVDVRMGTTCLGNLQAAGQNPLLNYRLYVRQLQCAPACVCQACQGRLDPSSWQYRQAAACELPARSRCVRPATLLHPT